MLRKIGVSRLVVSPDGDGWMFKGQGDFTGLLPGHKRVQAAPPDCPPPITRAGCLQERGGGKSRRSNTLDLPTCGAPRFLSRLLD